ncbi:HIT domain-containing protein [Streptomyces morookaense]|uniref:HIT domain-containing protein n=1 Tax=Streptomyces morookaense TaxID=1970 RepID=UPI0033D2D8EB
MNHTRPACPVHIVVVPQEHVPSLIDPGEPGEKVIGEVMAVVREVAARVCEEHGAATVVTNLGRYQGSRHLRRAPRVPDTDVRARQVRIDRRRRRGARPRPPRPARPAVG